MKTFKNSINTDSQKALRALMLRLPLPTQSCSVSVNVPLLGLEELVDLASREVNSPFQSEWSKRCNCRQAGFLVMGPTRTNTDPLLRMSMYQ